MVFLGMIVRRRRKRDLTGKKIVYITPYRNLAHEMKKEYERKGEKTVVEAERAESGETMYIVCIFPR
jgi:replicative superfamily II helicase